MITVEVAETPGSWALDASGILFNHGPADVLVLTASGIDWAAAPRLVPGITARMAVASSHVSAMTTSAGLATLDVHVEAMSAVAPLGEVPAASYAVRRIGF